MANPVVYDWFMGFVPVNINGAVFHETQGKMLQQTGLPDLWVTVEWDKSSRQRLTVGDRWISREYGTCTVIFVGKSGRGPVAVQDAGQAFADAVDASAAIAGVPLVEASGRTGTLRIENTSPPDPEPYEDGNWLMCTVSCVYTYDSVRGAAVTP